VYRAWVGLGRRRNSELWEMFPSTVNAYFEPAANEVCDDWLSSVGTHSALDCFPCWNNATSILLSSVVRDIPLLISFKLLSTIPFPRPAYISYGAFGAVAAHELTVSLYLAF